MNDCSHCLDEFIHLPYQYAIVEPNGEIEVREAFCCFMCMKFWFEDEEKERGWVEKR